MFDDGYLYNPATFLTTCGKWYPVVNIFRQGFIPQSDLNSLLEYQTKVKNAAITWFWISVIVGSCVLAAGFCMLFKIIRKEKEEKEIEDESYRASGDLDNPRRSNDFDKAALTSSQTKGPINATKIIESSLESEGKAPQDDAELLIDVESPQMTDNE